MRITTIAENNIKSRGKTPRLFISSRPFRISARQKFSRADIRFALRLGYTDDPYFRKLVGESKAQVKYRIVGERRLTGVSCIR